MNLYNSHTIRNNIIEAGITNFDLLTQVENEKIRRYDLIANEIALMYKCKVKIIPYVMISRICEIPQEIWG